MNALELASKHLIEAWKDNWQANGWQLEMMRFENALQSQLPRAMNWADIVPLGHFATWACEPNETSEQLRNMLARYSQSDAKVKPTFCRACGASIPHRIGEGRCPECVHHLPNRKVDAASDLLIEHLIDSASADAGTKS